MKLQVANGPLGVRLLFRSFLKTLTQISCVLSRKSYFSGQLAWRATAFHLLFRQDISFMKLCSFMNRKSEKNVSFFYFRLFELLVEEGLLHGKLLFIGKVNFFKKITKWFLSLLSKSLKNIHPKSLLLSWTQKQPSEVFCKKYVLSS